METLEWLFKLIDGMSGPASKITGALGGVEGALKKSSGGANNFSKQMGEATRSAFYAISVFSQIKNAVVGLAESGWDFTKFALGAAAFKQSMMIGFELMEGSATKAQETYKSVHAMADKTPWKTDTVMKNMRLLRMTGFNAEESSNIFAALSDMGSAAGAGPQGEETMNRMHEHIARISSAGHMSKMELMHMSMTSGGMLNQGEVIKSLATKRGVSEEQIHSLMSAGGISSNEGIGAILSTIQRTIDKGDPLGKATQKMGMESLPGQVSTLQSRISQLFEGIDVKPFVDVMTKINTLLSEDSDTGKKFRKDFEDIFKHVGDALLKVDWDHVLTSIEKLIRNVIRLSEAFGKGFIDQFSKDFGTLMDEVDADPGAMDRRIEQFVKLGKAAASLLALLDRLIGVVGDVDAALGATRVSDKIKINPTESELGAATPSAKDWFNASFGASDVQSQGGSMVEGLWAGISSKTDWFHDKWHGFIASIHGSSADELEIRSPSRKLWRQGNMLPVGLVGGIDENAHLVDRAIRNMTDFDVAMPAINSMSANDLGAGLRGSAASTSRGGTTQIGPITIQVESGGESVAEDIGAAMRRELPRIFASARAELGL